MRGSRFPHGRVLLLLLFIGSHAPLSGCTDNSRTTGTLVEVSEETKAYRKTKIESYKGGAPKSKGKAASAKMK